MKKKFSWRAFISFGLIKTLAILFIPGIQLFVFPRAILFKHIQPD